MLPTSLKPTAHRLLDRLAVLGSRRYVAGETVNAALTVIGKQIFPPERYIICPWNRPTDSVKGVFTSYLEALDSLKDFPCDSFLSIKLPSLSYDAAMVEELLNRAAALKIRIHFDALTPESVEPTIRVLAKLRARFSLFGYTIPGRWRRSLRDASSILDLQIPLRVVKGQLPDRSGGEVDPREGFLQVVERISRSTTSIGIASHDPLLVTRSLSLLKGRIGGDEVEQLFGLKPVSVKVLGDTPTRLYIPYGHGYPPYDIYAAFRAPRLAARMTRDVVSGILRPVMDGLRVYQPGKNF